MEDNDHQECVISHHGDSTTLTQETLKLIIPQLRLEAERSTVEIILTMTAARNGPESKQTMGNGNRDITSHYHGKWIIETGMVSDQIFSQNKIKPRKMDSEPTFWIESIQKPCYESTQ